MGIFIIKKINLDGNNKEFSSILLQNKETGEYKEWTLSLELMDFTMENDLQIESDLRAKVLVYTKKYPDGNIRPTIKGFYPGDQTNLLLLEDYIKEHHLLG